jgi:hypothetical protein
VPLYLLKIYLLVQASTDPLQNLDFTNNPSFLLFVHTMTHEVDFKDLTIGCSVRYENGVRLRELRVIKTSVSSIIHAEAPDSTFSSLLSNSSPPTLRDFFLLTPVELFCIPNTKPSTNTIIRNALSLARQRPKLTTQLASV